VATFLHRCYASTRHSRFRTVRGVDDHYIGSHSTPWPDPLRGPWLIRFHWGEVNGRAECIGLDVRSFRAKEGDLESPRPLRRGGSFEVVTTTLLRSLRADGLISDNRNDFKDLAAWARGRQESQAKVRRVAAQALQSLEQPRRRGRPPKYTAEHYAEVANVYANAAENRTPRRAVARHFDVTEATAAHWVRKARELGFLGKSAGRGRVGDVTPTKARRRSQRGKENDA